MIARVLSIDPLLHAFAVGAAAFLLAALLLKREPPPAPAPPAAPAITVVPKTQPLIVPKLTEQLPPTPSLRLVTVVNRTVPLIIHESEPIRPPPQPVKPVAKAAPHLIQPVPKPRPVPKPPERTRVSADPDRFAQWCKGKRTGAWWRVKGIKRYCRGRRLRSQ